MTAADPPPYATASMTCYRHPDRDAGVRCVRCDRPICSACMIPAAVGFQCPECVREGNRSIRRPASRYGGRVPVANSVVTYLLIAVNVAIFLATTIDEIAQAHQTVSSAVFSPNPNAPIYVHFALIAPAVAHGAWWRLVSAAFLHYGLLHIGFNMFALYYTGPVIEQALGRWRYLVLYFAAGIGGSLLTVGIASPTVPSAGASGAIFGIFGAVYVIQRRAGQRTQTILPIIVINLILSFTLADISWEGHIGGLITGSALCAALVATAGSVASRTQRHLAVCAAAAIVLAVCGFVAVHAEEHRCATSGGYTRSLCEYYDPGSAASTGGNVTAPAVVVPSDSIMRPGGHHA
jgi:membrane associated rhomboid family serine protease